jgi:N-acetylglucosamine-6-phosphate deacetylase
MRNHMIIKNCRVISPGLDLKGAAVEVEDGQIKRVLGPENQPSPAEYATTPTHDAHGALLMPGFIDIHTHGAMGADTCDGTETAVRTIAMAKLREGVTTFLPTTLTLPLPNLMASARAVAAYRNNMDGAQTPGLHIEGPFLNPKFIGAQNPAFVRPPDPTEIFALQEITPVLIVSIATEMPGGIDFVHAMTKAGITTSLAHTAATRDDFLAAKTAGLTHLTHFCCQQSPLHHRALGVVGSGLLDDDVRLEIISDTIHLNPDMLRLVFKIKPLRQLMLITDSMAASGLGDGTFNLGGLEVTVLKGVARLSPETLAGSTLKFNDGLKHAAHLSGAPLSELVATTSWNQAQSLGLPKVGKIEPGFAADFVLLDHDFTVQSTWIAGTQRFAA